ncbi:MAG: molybdopterin-dependent oxidoreductase [Deltaproteobacteria bacterium]|nr:molybdopterin-dependent oxidoreductase [Deltaproteobacteria bacterium]
MGHHLSTCPLCEASCGLKIETDGPRVVRIEGDPDDPLSRGHLCPKAVALQDLHTDPDRLRRPLLRDGSTHRELSWDEALDLAAKRLGRVQKDHGPDAVATYLGNPVIHNLGAMVMTPLFIEALGTRSRFSAASIDQLPQMVAALPLFGHQLLVPVPDLERTDLLLLFGANPAASNGSLMTAGGVTDRLDAIKARGRVVLLDPRRTESTRHASEHHFIRPGSDALAMLAMLHVLFAEGLTRLGKVGAFTDGVADVEAVARRFPPERVAARTGISADTIRRLARELATTERAAVYGRIGVSIQAYGTLAAWCVFALNIVTGHLDVPGGVMFPTPAIDALRLGRFYPPARYATRKSRVRGLPDFADEFPVAALAEEIETPGEGQIRALVTVAGNPALSVPNGRRMQRALASLEVFIAIDPYLNETTRHADLILPPTSPLERPHYDLALYHFAVRNTARYTPAVFARDADARHDWEILAGLAERVAPKGARGLGLKLAAKAATRLGLDRVDRILDLALRTGPRGSRPFGTGDLSMAKLREHPHGVDLGPLEETLPGRLRTANRRIQLAPRFILDDLPRLERELLGPEAPRDAHAQTPLELPLELIGRRHLRSNNSWLHNSQRLMKGKPRCTLMMHPDDATARLLVHGDEVRITSRRGEVVAPLEVTADVMPGVVSLPHGFGHHGPIRMRVASTHAGVSQNELTDELRVDPLSGNAAFSGTPVEVHAING